MSTVVNPVLPPTALLRPQMPSVYQRAMVYDPRWADPSYNAYVGQRIVPAPGSVVQDTDGTPLWVTSINDVTLYPTYQAITLSTDNDNVVSLLDYGETTLRLFTDTRALPYPVTPDSKCVVIGKSPRFYSLTRYPGTSRETVISEYYDATGTLVSQFVPVVALDSSKSSWYLPRSHVSVSLEHNEEVQVKVFGEDGAEVFSALLFAKESAVVNEDVFYSPTIVGMTISGNQQLANGTFFVYEKQDFGSLGLTATLVYDDGTTQIVPIDGTKCIMYGQEDFISSYAGLRQNVTVKYYRSESESINPSVGDATGQMISMDVPVTVIPNAFAATNKILPIPTYNSTLARYIMRYWLYFADGRSHIDVTPFVNINVGNLSTEAPFFGITQSYAISVDMKNVDPITYPTSTIYQQGIVIQFGPPNVLVRWTIRDAVSSPYILGQDIPTARRPSILYDTAKKQYFVPSAVFANTPAFVNSFYTQTSPPYDPSVASIPQAPTHFVVRDILTGSQLVSAPIPVGNYKDPFNIIGDTVGNYVNTVVVVEFLNIVNSSVKNVLFGCPVNVNSGTYL
jgi:hypothetical protein